MKDRRHHNNKGVRQIRHGKTRDQVKAIAHRVGVPYGDLRNAVARARDDWFDSHEGMRCSDGYAEGVYLRNRLEAAFVAGYNARDPLTHA